MFSNWDKVETYSLAKRLLEGTNLPIIFAFFTGN